MKDQMKTLLTSRYEARKNLWLQKGEAQEFSYSDGDDTENRIHGIVTGADDVSLFSAELKAAQTDWASRYHLSATRANLLRPLASILSGSVLEIGSGCGAISRFLGELGGEVIGVEGSPRRAAIAASRCRDLPNVNIVNEVFDDFPVDAKFDAVTLIGVLEYASIFGKTKNPALTWLRKAYESLEDGGHLVIAIENQLGLKYLAGMPEDHLAKAMFGINDLYGDGTATTYGRVELTRMLHAAGFGSVEVALPFPDYKLPTSVVLPRAYDGSHPGFDASAFARQSVNADAQLIHAPLFSLGQAWGVVGRNDLLPDLANSFLIVARKGSAPAAWAVSGALAHHFSTERLPAYCKQVSFVPEADGIVVQKALLAPDLHGQEMRPISLVLEDEAYVFGANHGDRFERIVSAPGWQIADVAAWFGEWQDALDDLLDSRSVAGPRHLHSLLPDWTIDALPRNLMRDAEGWHFIDLEWGWRAGVEYGYLAYRAVTIAMASLNAIAMPADNRHVFIRHVMQDVLLARGLGISAMDLQRYVELDGVLRKLAYGVSVDFSVHEFSTFQLPVMPDVTSLVIDAASDGRALAARRHAMTESEAEFEAQHARESHEHEHALVELAEVRSELVAIAHASSESALRAQQREAELVHEAASLRASLVSLQEVHAWSVATGAHLQTQLSSVLTSKSWRLMAPLRVGRRVLGPRALRQRAGRMARAAFRALPLSGDTKHAMKNMVFKALSPALRSTAAYQAWTREEQPAATTPSSSAPADDTVAVSPKTAVSVAPRDEYVPIAASPVRRGDIDVRLVAFYLPQFHAIPENDVWWGRGFTEWTNVSKARPQYQGHHQPQLPGELGFYDLRLLDVMKRQAELAELYGVAGFCFHHYWFGGKRLLERPVNQFLASDVDFPFCICWANENWTRRWDGMDGEILIGQSHSDEDDLAFIESLDPMLRDDRYIRVNGKPLIIIYRPSVIPDAAATITRWRDYCRRVGIGEIFMGMVQFDVDDPRVYGFDAAIEFPPHKLARNLSAMNTEIDGINPEFEGTIIDYKAIVERAAEVRSEGFNLFRGVFPSWDNEARKPGRGYMFHGATPERYGDWLRQSLEFAREHPVEGERLVFVNAWNEWAEGAHLEPDRRYGYAFLQATRDALVACSSERVSSAKVILVTHDAHPHGAQYLALHLAKELHDVFGFDVEIVCLGEGPLIDKFRQFGDVHLLSGLRQDGDEAKALAGRLAATTRYAIVNSTVSGLFAGVLAEAGVQLVSLVHELPGVIREYGIEPNAKAIVSASRSIFFPSAVVQDGFAQFAPLDGVASAIRPQGLFTRNHWRGSRDRLVPRAALRKKLGLPGGAEIVLAVGYVDLRKGADLFVAAALALLASGRNAHFVWVGHADERLLGRLLEQISDAGHGAQFHFVGMDFDTDLYYAGADLYALASREDPFPSVVLEALAVGLPVVAFVGAGGAADILRRGCGLLVDRIDAEMLAVTMGSALSDPGLRTRLGDVGMHLVATEFSFRRYVFDLLDAAGMVLPKVTAVVPNYNYAHLLGERLRSIDKQTFPVYELIVLDDQSSDDSLAVLADLRPSIGTDFVVVENASNSGSVFRQWLLGAERAQGELIWIAEADDSCERTFLQNVAPALANDATVVMSYSQSKQMNAAGQIIADDYLGYTNDVDDRRWRVDYVNDGADEIREALSIKNTIPNVSAVVFRTAVLRDVLLGGIDEIGTFRIAGDWLTYMMLASRGRIAYTARSLNKHRRHESSVTLGSDYVLHLTEVLRMQKIARERYGAGANEAVRAWLYSEGLYASFGLRSASAPTLADRDEFASFRH